MKALIITLLLFVLGPLSLFAQIAEGDHHLYLGIAPGAALRWQSGELRTCPLPDCLPFTEGTGTGMAIGVRAMYRLGGDLFLRGGAGWEQVGSTFTETRRNYPILGQGNRVERVDMRNELEAGVSTLQIEAGVAYMIMQPSIFVAAGPVLTLPLSTTWKQTEIITGPTGVRYADGSDSKVLLDEEIPAVSAFLSLRMGLGALLAVTDAIAILPEAYYTLPLGDLQPDFDWTTAGIDVSLAVLLRI